MLALILTEGGSRSGFGHISRCRALQTALQEIGVKTKLIVDADKSVHTHLKGKNVYFFNWRHQQQKLFTLIKQARVVMIDSYLAPLSLYQKISRLPVTLFCLDDNVRIPYPKGFVINGTIGADKLPYQRNTESKYLLGSQYVLLRKEFWALSKCTTRRSISNVLITFGGMDRSKYVQALAFYLIRQFPDLTIHVINPQNQCAKTKHARINYYRNLRAEQMLKLMKRCDVAICGGGQTTNELARCGVPSIAVCFAQNQKPNIKGWQDKGALVYAGKFGDENLNEKIIRTLSRLNFKKRQQMSKVGQIAVDGQGARRLARIVSKQ